MKCQVLFSVKIRKQYQYNVTQKYGDVYSFYIIYLFLYKVNNYGYRLFDQVSSSRITGNL